MRYSTTATTLARQADDSLLGVRVSTSYTFSEGEAKYLQAIADAGDKQPEEILDSVLRFEEYEGEQPYLIGWSESSKYNRQYKASSTIMSAALSMFLHEPSPVDPPPFHDPKPRKGRILAGTVPDDPKSWERAAQRWKKHLSSSEDGYSSEGKARAVEAFDEALWAALRFDGKGCRAFVIKAAQAAGIYTCCHECANCQSLGHYPCCHGMCNQPTVTQFNTLTAAMLERLIMHAESEKLNVYRLIAAMAMVVEYDEITAEQRDKAERELFSAVHKLQVRLER